jgi:chromosome partitioning protein
MFTLPEAREWVKQVADLPKSPLLSGKPGKGKVLLSTQLKGGSCKTMTAMNIAQGLSLRGRKVLVIDLDPQASITELCGVLAYMQLSVDDTVLNSVLDPQNFHLKDVVLETYWDGIDVIPAHPGLFSAEFHLPAMTNTDNKFRFWAQMRLAVEPLREHYDYIVVDTAPSLSYLTINGLMAADALIMPLVPESIDFMSSVSFWGLFADMAETFLARGEQKKYDFISVLLSKVDNVPNGPTSSVRSWAQSAYGDWMQMIEIPKSSVVGASGLALSTVFDMSKGVVPERSLDRIRDPLVAYCKWLDEQYTDHWEAT